MAGPSKNEKYSVQSVHSPKIVTSQDEIKDRFDLEGYTKSIDREHDETHKGNSFRVCNRADVLDDGNIDLVLETGSKKCHLIFGANVEANADIDFMEGVVVTAATGTELPVRNKNRSSSKLSTAIALLAPTITDLGTLIQPLFVPGGSGGIPNGGAGQERLEWILKPNTKYLFRLTNISGQTKRFNEYLEWYEED